MNESAKKDPNQESRSLGRAGRIIVSFFGLGYLPVAPGSWGSAGAALLYLALRYTVDPGFLTCIAVAVLFSLVTVALGSRAEAAYGRKDPSHVVTDEVAGYFLSAAFLVPVHPVAAALCAFLLFRVLDVLKPPPARMLEKLPGGWGIVLDDLAAGGYACLLGHGVFLLALPRYIA